MLHNKWFKSIGKGSIEIREEIYTLSATENKRKLIYNEDNIFIDTQPLTIDESKTLK